MLGAIVGDIVGSFYEWHNTHAILEKLEQMRCGIYHDEYHQNDISPVYAKGEKIGDFMGKIASSSDDK